MAPIILMGGAWVLMRLLFLVLVLAVVAVLIGRGGPGWHRSYRGPAPDYRSNSPEEILRERFARGEIGREQYREALVEMLKDRYIRDELSLEEYEARLNFLAGDLLRTAPSDRETPAAQASQGKGGV